MSQYSVEVMQLFNNPQHVYTISAPYTLIAGDGDTKIGEYINLYLLLDEPRKGWEARIIRASYSAMGGVALIASAENLCRRIDGRIVQNVLGEEHTIQVPENKTHSLGFVLSAWFTLVQQMTNN